MRLRNKFVGAFSRPIFQNHLLALSKASFKEELLGRILSEMFNSSSRTWSRIEAHTVGKAFKRVLFVEIFVAKRFSRLLKCFCRSIKEVQFFVENDGLFVSN